MYLTFSDFISILNLIILSGLLWQSGRIYKTITKKEDKKNPPE